MKKLNVKIIANINGKDVPWEELDDAEKCRIATGLNEQAMAAAGYEKAPTKQQLR
jgi:hypothetical protein